MDEHVRRNPVPSLLRSLLSEHLDPGYAAASRQPPTGPRRERMLVVLGAVLVGCVFGVASSQAIGSFGTGDAQREALDSVRRAQDRIAALDDSRRTLATHLDAERESALRDDSRGAAVLTDLDRLEADAGVSAATGPGIEVVVAEPPQRADLSDVARPVRGSTDAVVFDRDLQTVVNSLWVSGAESVAVDGVRIGPGVTVRQAGGAMLVDNTPVFSPYQVTAIGSPTQLQARFFVSDAYLRISALAQLYRVGFDVRAVDVIDMSGSADRTIRLASVKGEP